MNTDKDPLWGYATTVPSNGAAAIPTTPQELRKAMRDTLAAARKFQEQNGVLPTDIVFDKASWDKIKDYTRTRQGADDLRDEARRQERIGGPFGAIMYHIKPDAPAALAAALEIATHGGRIILVTTDEHDGMTHSINVCRASDATADNLKPTFPHENPVHTAEIT